MSPKELRDLMLLTLMTPMKGSPGEGSCVWGLTLHITGEPAVGKTSIVDQAGDDLSLKSVSLRAGPHPPEDFAGALIPDGTGGAKQICALGPVREIIKEKAGIIFLDEINSASPATQGALQGMINERIVGDEKLPNRVRLIAASNPEELATGGYRLSAPMANRLVHVTYDGGTIDDWVNWNTGAVDTPNKTLLNYERELEERWPVNFAKAKGLFISFIKARGDLLHKRPPKASKESGGAWPSRRTWDFAQRAWATYTSLGADLGITELTRDAAIQGCVGTGAAEALLEYARMNDLPSPEDVLSGKWTLSKKRLDITIGAYSSAISLVIQTRDRDQQLELAAKAWTRLMDLVNNGLADVTIPIIKALAANNLVLRTSAGVSPAANAVCVEADKVLLALDKTGVARMI